MVIVWRLDHWGRSLADLVTTLQELTQLGIGFISLNEALDLTTPAGRAMAGMLSVFAELEREIIRERVKAGIRRQKAEGRQIGRPQTAAKKEKEVRRPFAKGLSKAEIARCVGIGRTSVRRLLA